ncbi:MAG: SDR family NAD(P)-dependent oxidoreductase [Bdellovibrionota bacterium]
MVTGGAGFIGSHLCRRLLSDGHDVVAFDNLVLGRKEFLQPFESNSKFRFVEADLTDLARVKKEMQGIELVVHMAANSDISQGAARTDVDMNNGTIATYNTLEAMRVNSVGQIIFASTSAIYGEADVKPTPEGYGPLFPISFYGASKLACEAMVSAFSHNCGIKAWVYRFANIVGTPSTHGAIHDFVSRLLKDPKKLEVLGNGTQRKSYLHVDDCVSGMLFGYEKSRQSFQCYNLASKGVSNVRFIAEEVVRQMTAVTGHAAELKFGEGDRGWVGDVPYTYLDGSKLEGLGFQPKHDSDDAVRTAIREIISIRTAGMAAR